MNLTPQELANTLLALRLLQGVPFSLQGSMPLDGYDPMSAEEIDALCEKLNVVEEPIIYDSLPADDPNGVTDRYTVFPYPHATGPAERHTYLGCSIGGRAVSMWGELEDSHVVDGFDHLGRRLTLADLDEDTRRHILGRLSEEC